MSIFPTDTILLLFIAPRISAMESRFSQQTPPFSDFSLKYEYIRYYVTVEPAARSAIRFIKSSIRSLTGKEGGPIYDFSSSRQRREKQNRYSERNDLFFFFFLPGPVSSDSMWTKNTSVLSQYLSELTLTNECFVFRQLTLAAAWPRQQTCMKTQTARSVTIVGILTCGFRPKASF